MLKEVRDITWDIAANFCSTQYQSYSYFESMYNLTDPFYLKNGLSGNTPYDYNKTRTMWDEQSILSPWFDLTTSKAMECLVLYKILEPTLVYNANLQEFVLQIQAILDNLNITNTLRYTAKEFDYTNPNTGNNHSIFLLPIYLPQIPTGLDALSFQNRFGGIVSFQGFMDIFSGRNPSLTSVADIKNFPKFDEGQFLTDAPFIFNLPQSSIVQINSTYHTTTPANTFSVNGLTIRPFQMQSLNLGVADALVDLDLEDLRKKYPPKQFRNNDTNLVCYNCKKETIPLFHMDRYCKECKC